MMSQALEVHALEAEKAVHGSAALPGIDLDERNLWVIAGTISQGTFPGPVW